MNKTKGSGRKASANGAQRSSKSAGGAGGAGGANGKSVVAIRNIDAAPKDSFPVVASSFKPLDGKGVKRLRHMTEEEQQAAGHFAGELRAADPHEYQVTFTNRAPDRAKMADRLDLAVAWQKRASMAERYSHYATTMATAAWDAAGRDVRVFAGKFRDALEDDGSIATAYPSSAAFVGVRTAISARGAKTRKANAKRKKAAPAASASK